MSRGINKATILGYVGGDPEIRATASGITVATISVATSEVWKDKNTGEKKEKTQWHRISLFNKLGEIAGKFIKKGSRVYIEGTINHTKYTDKQGVERYTTDIIAKELLLMDSSDAKENKEAKNAALDAEMEAYANKDYKGPGETLVDDIPF
jgi:single-strand DNA-binding protein